MPENLNLAQISTLLNVAPHLLSTAIDQGILKPLPGSTGGKKHKAGLYSRASVIDAYPKIKALPGHNGKEANPALFAQKRPKPSKEARKAQLELQRTQKLESLRGRLGSMEPSEFITLEDFEELGLDYFSSNNKKLTLLRARKEYGLSDEHQAHLLNLQQEIINAKKEKAEQARQAAQERRKQEDFLNSLHTQDELRNVLGITPTEFQRWAQAGLIKEAAQKTFYKWGKSNIVKLFNPEDYPAIKENLLVWRKEHEDNLKAVRASASKKALESKRSNKGLRDAAGLSDYLSSFELARSLKRDLEFLVGPPNSGKTYKALQALKAAPTGIYLAPLRLLALENYEYLQSAGVAVSLLTGEEQIIHPQATHVCATVEMCSFTKNFDVAVIDEIQMISDSERGSGWTNACLGVAASKVYMCGGKSARPYLQKLSELTGEPLTVTQFTRLQPLEISYGVNKTPVSSEGLKRGDAIVAFSRKQVLSIAYLLLKEGRKVSMIYGALSPETRRLQAKRFASGETHFLVATDAIGMGLNLPIKRVLFSDLKKFDGQSFRFLTKEELNQIAGRAGRYGLAEAGAVGLYRSEYLRDGYGHLERMLDLSVNAGISSGPVQVGANSRLCSVKCDPSEVDASKFRITPNFNHVKAALDFDQVTRPHIQPCVTGALEFLNRVPISKPFIQWDLSDLIKKSLLIERTVLQATSQARADLNVQDIFNLATLPVDLDKPGHVHFLQKAASDLAEWNAQWLKHLEKNSSLETSQAHEHLLQEPSSMLRGSSLRKRKCWINPVEVSSQTDLELLEQFSNLMTLYSCLTNKFPAVFCFDGVRQTLVEIAQRIDFLLISKKFDNPKEYFTERFYRGRRREGRYCEVGYDGDDDDEDFDDYQD